MPWALATPDGFPTKTDKSKLMHKIEEENKQGPPLPTEDKVYIVDGNAMIQAMVNVPTTFGEVSQSLFQSLSRAKRVDFVIDSYVSDSIKDA